MISIVDGIILVLVTVKPSYGALAWGSFFGADWNVGEGEAKSGNNQFQALVQKDDHVLSKGKRSLLGNKNIRKNIVYALNNAQSKCMNDIQHICLENGQPAIAKENAINDWKSSDYKRHTYKSFNEVPIGFTNEVDECLHSQIDQQKSGKSTRLSAQCVEWMEKTEEWFTILIQRESGNDKREAFVIFSTILMIVVSSSLGFIMRVILKEQSDLYSYRNRTEKKKIVAILFIVISLPMLIIVWTSPRFFMIMILAFLAGGLVQLLHQKRQDYSYSSLSNSDNGVVFAAIPIGLD